MASDEGDKAAGGKPSMMVWLGIMLVMTLVAVGGGAALGLYLASKSETMSKEVKEVAETPAPNRVLNSNVRDLPPIITNLDQTSDTWIRLHVAIVFDPAKVEKPDVLAAEVASDILGFMQTVSVAQLSGSSGLQHLKEDLTDRAIIRSDGRISELVIESLVMQ
jgi:flagellar FliL protein